MTKFNPYAAPPPGLHDSEGPSRAAHIAALPVSDAWRAKFLLIEKAGGARMPRLKSLTSSERFTITFNFLAFLFWPFYYFVKRMWKKGVVMVSIGLFSLLILSIFLSGLGLGRYATVLACAIGVYFGMRANVDYYKQMVLKEVDDWL
jgi:hypothetical protein